MGRWNRERERQSEFVISDYKFTRFRIFYRQGKLFWIWRYISRFFYIFAHLTVSNVAEKAELRMINGALSFSCWFQAAHMCNIICQVLSIIGFPGTTGRRCHFALPTTSGLRSKYYPRQFSVTSVQGTSGKHRVACDAGYVDSETKLVSLCRSHALWYIVSYHNGGLKSCNLLRLTTA